MKNHREKIYYNILHWFYIILLPNKFKVKIYYYIFLLNIVLVGAGYTKYIFKNVNILNKCVFNNEAKNGFN